MEKSQEESTANTEREICIIDSLTVKLLPGISKKDLGLSLEDRADVLANSLQKATGRSVAKIDLVMYTEEEISKIIENTIDGVDLPELQSPLDADIAKIQADFPGLTEEEIYENWDTISTIYVDQISALSLNNVISDVKINSARYSFWIKGKEITTYEISAMLMFPFSAVTLWQQRQKALDLTAQYMPSDKDDNKSDAFRHGIWTVVMAKMGWGNKDLKLAWARTFSLAHELGGKYKGTASEMDLHNNEIGLNYYADVATKKYTKILWWRFETGVNEPSYEQAAAVIKNKAINAVFVDNNLPYDTVKAKIKAVDTRTLVYIIPDDKKY